MTLKVVTGHLLNSKDDVIIHQVPCDDTSLSDISKQIFAEYPVVYDWFKLKQNEYKDNTKFLLGLAQICYKENYQIDNVEDKQNIVNLFSQRTGLTDYDALRKGLECVNRTYSGSSVSLPYLMGCRNENGNWLLIAKIINEALKDCDVTAYYEGD